MKANKNNREKKKNCPEGPESISRRKILKKAVYVAPTIIALGVLSPIEAVAGSLPPPPPPPGQQSIPSYWPQKFKK